MTRALLNWLRVSWDAIRTSLWALAMVMFVLGAGLAVLMLRVELLWPDPPEQWRDWISSGDGEDARNLLSTLLTAVISLAGIVFSITVVSLSLAANAYGPRLIRTVRSSLTTQLVIGILTMTIVYLLLVLRAVRGDASAGEVPEAAVALGSILALISVLGLLGFIQGVATLIVADEVVRRVRNEFDSAIQELPRIDETPEQPASGLPEDFEAKAGRIRLPREGYVQSVEYSELVDWAEKHDSVIRMDFRPVISSSAAITRCWSVRRRRIRTRCEARSAASSSAANAVRRPRTSNSPSGTSLKWRCGRFLPASTTPLRQSR